MRKRPDIILLHPPSVYDFRSRNESIFPNIYNSVVRVSPMFEIMPLGFYNIKSYLQAQNINAQIYNLASRMLGDWDWDADEFLRSLKPRIFGIDLHWLIHAQGALELCRRIKSMHADIPVVFGGITASYYYKELAGYPFVDFVIRGNIPFRPLRLLISHILQNDRDYSGIPNLCYKAGGKIIVTKSENYDESSFYSIDWGVMGKERKRVNFIVVNPQLGCKYNCCFCGGSRFATRKYYLQGRELLYRPRSQILKELDSLESFRSRYRRKIKLIVVNHWHENDKLRHSFLSKLKKLNLFSTVHISLFNLMSLKTVKDIARYVNPVFEISPQSHDPKIRSFCYCARYSNKDLERWLGEVLNLTAGRVEVYFMIGLPLQTEASVLETVRYCEYLLKKFKQTKRVVPFLGSMLPFLDPGSPAFQDPGRYGYRIFYKTLREHSSALTATSLKNRLNYETEWMSRSQIVETVNKSARMITLSKVRHGYLTIEIGKAIIKRLDDTFRMIHALDRVDSIKDREKRSNALSDIRNKILSYNREILSGRFCDQFPINVPLYDFWYEG